MLFRLLTPYIHTYIQVPHFHSVQLLHGSRVSTAAVRASPDPTRLHHQPMVRLLGAHALGRRENQTAGEKQYYAHTYTLTYKNTYVHGGKAY